MFKVNWFELCLRRGGSPCQYSATITFRTNLAVLFHSSQIDLNSKQSTVPVKGGRHGLSRLR